MTYSPPTAPPSSVKDMLAAIGLLALLWGDAQGDIDRALLDLGEQEAAGHPAAARLQHWSGAVRAALFPYPDHIQALTRAVAALNQIREVRDLVCHAGAPKVSSIEGRTVLTCRYRGQQVAAPAELVNRTVAELEATRGEIRRLTYLALKAKGVIA